MVYANAQSTDVTVAADAGSGLMDESQEAGRQTKASWEMDGWRERGSCVSQKAMPTFGAIK